MKFAVKEGGGTPFARKEDYEYEGNKFEADLKDGDNIKILDAGVKEVGKFGEQDNFKIMTRNGEKKVSLNQSTINVLVQELGEESESWIGKEVRVILQKAVIAGEKRIKLYLVTGDWALDDWGELSKPKAGKMKAHEEVGEGDFDDINKSIDANK